MIKKRKILSLIICLMLLPGEMGFLGYLSPDFVYSADESVSPEESEAQKDESSQKTEAPDEEADDSQDSKESQEGQDPKVSEDVKESEEKDDSAKTEEKTEEKIGEEQSAEEKESQPSKKEDKKEDTKEEKPEEGKTVTEDQKGDQKKEGPLNPETVDANSEDNPLNPKEGEEEDEKAEEEQQIEAYVPLLEYFDENFGTPLLYPLPSEAPITEEFGAVDYLHPTGHMGLDFGAAFGTPILAAESGVVTKAEYYGGYGYCVFINHGNSTETRYGHMSEMNVKEGDKVRRGQQIGRVGSTGHSTGPHLHFEVIFRGLFASPRLYIGLPQYIPTRKETTVDGMRVILETEYGAFDRDWQLEVTPSSPGKNNQATWAIDDIREEGKNPVKSYTFNIKVLDMDGNEMKPEGDSPLNITFDAPDNLEKNLNFGAYHMEDNPKITILKPSQLDTSHEQVVAFSGATPIEDGGEHQREKHPSVFKAQFLEIAGVSGEGNKEMTVKTNSLSYFTVEYTYDAKRFVLKDSNRASLKDILDKVGLLGEVTKWEIDEKDETIIKLVEEQDGVYVEAYKVFEESHPLRVTINDIQYEIGISNRYDPQEENKEKDIKANTN